MDLLQASEHLKYEFDMLVITAILLSKSNLNDSTRNAILESWVQHVRNLIDFFYTPKRQDDLVMKDFLEDNDVPSSFPPINPDLKSAKKRANKEMAHLTYTRVGIKIEEKKWPVSLITNLLVQRMKFFISIVPKDRVVEGLHEISTGKTGSTYLLDTVSDTVGQNFTKWDL